MYLFFQGGGYVNTPEGITYPATPPMTPDSRAAAAAAETNTAATVGEEDCFVDLQPPPGGVPIIQCHCEAPGVTFAGEQPMYCLALDAVDGQVCVFIVIRCFVLCVRYVGQMPIRYVLSST